jgi:hypothetical protein
MFAGEYALCFGGYVLAIELGRRSDALARRCLGVLPFAIPAALYVAVYVALGYGAGGTGFYRNPLRDFAFYARGVPRRAAILAGASWLGADDTWAGSPAWALALLAAATIAALAVVVYVLRGVDETERRRARWMLLGALLALPPVLCVAPFVRLLPASMVGVSGVVGVVLDRAWFSPERPSRRGMPALAGFVALGLAFAHLVRAPLGTLSVLVTMASAAGPHAERAAWLREHLDPARSTAFVLRGDSSETILWGPLQLGDQAPERWRVLSYTSGHSLLTRRGERTLELAQLERPLFAAGEDDLFRNASTLSVGQTMAVPGMTATILQLGDDGSPKRLRFELERPADDPSYQWIVEGPDGFRVQTPPPVGFGAQVQ